MRLSLVAALDRNFAIGKDNGLPWHLPDDLKRFKALTLGKPLLMGRQHRRIARPRAARAAQPGADAQRRGAVRGHGSGRDARRRAARSPDAGDELCVIGGGEVFALTLPLATRMHLTWVDTRRRGRRRVLPALRSWRMAVAAREAHPAR